MPDPYLDVTQSYLLNKLGLTNQSELDHAEVEIAAIRDVDLARSTLPGAYDAAHLMGFHSKLFGDIYAWAGKTRTVDIGKGDPSGRYTQFCRAVHVDEQLSQVTEVMAEETWLRGLPPQRFVERLAYFYGELNVIHPFREGNGRTQRAFFRQLAAAAGYRLDWSKVDRQQNIEACSSDINDIGSRALVAMLEPAVSRKRL